MTIREGMGWTAQEPVERWEADGAALRDGVLETVRELQGGDFTPDEADIRLLMESVKASIPALVEHMKDTRPELEIHREILEEFGLLPQTKEDDLVRQCALTDEQWAQVQGLLPPEKTGRGRAFKSNRLILDGILYHMITGTAWKNLPQCFGRYKCVSDRLRLWERTGVWGPVAEQLRKLGIDARP